MVPRLTLIHGKTLKILLKNNLLSLFIESNCLIYLRGPERHKKLHILVKRGYSGACFPSCIHLIYALHFYVDVNSFVILN